MRARDLLRAPTALALAGALAATGCGDTKAQLAPIERDELHGFVDRARTAARAKDPTATHAALEALQARVRELRGAGRLDREAAEQLLKYSAVTQLRARRTLGSAPPAAPAAQAESELPVAPPAEAAPDPSAAPAAEAEPSGNDQGKAKGKDNNDKGKDKDKAGD